MPKHGGEMDDLSTSLLDKPQLNVTRPASPVAPVRLAGGPAAALLLEPDEPEPEPEPEPLLPSSYSDDGVRPPARASETAAPQSGDDEDDFATLYHDNALKDGCTQCPPTFTGLKTFAAHLVRAIFPFVLLGELSLRWCRRKGMDESELKKTQRGRFITVRLVAECVGRLFHMVLVYMVLCNSLKMHRWLKSTFGDGVGTDQGDALKLFAGEDPAERQEHSYVDVAISETFYPLWAFLLLAALYAHEETSYPRRTRVEYSVETDSLLLRGVSLMKQLEAPEDRAVRQISPPGETQLEIFGYDAPNGRGGFEPVKFDDGIQNALIASERTKTNPNPIPVTDPRNDLLTFEVHIAPGGSQDVPSTVMKLKLIRDKRRLCGCELWTKAVEQNNGLLFISVVFLFLGLQTFVMYWMEYARPCVSNSPVRTLRTLNNTTFMCTGGDLACLSIGLMYIAESGCNFYGTSGSLEGSSLKSHNGVLSVSFLCVLLSGEAFAFCSGMITEDWDCFLTENGLVVPIGSICVFAAGTLLIFVLFTGGGSEKFAALYTAKYNDVVQDLAKEPLASTQANDRYSDRYTRKFRELQCTPIENYHLTKFQPYQKKGKIGARGDGKRRPSTVAAQKEAEKEMAGTAPPQSEFYQEFEGVLIHGMQDSIRTPDREPIIRNIEKLRQQMPNGEKPLTADLVAKMILQLSKARQLKRRLQWRGGGAKGQIFFSPLYLISIGHASIPFVFTFVATLPYVTMAVGAFLVVAGLVASCMNEEIRMHTAKQRTCEDRLRQANRITSEVADIESARDRYKTELDELKHQQSPQVKQDQKAEEVAHKRDQLHTLRQQAKENKATPQRIQLLKDHQKVHQTKKERWESVVKGWKVFCGLSSMVWFVVGIQWHMLFDPTERFQEADTCGNILDTQGQCCCHNRTQLDAAASFDSMEDALCCPSYFNPREFEGNVHFPDWLVVPKAMYKNPDKAGCKQCAFSYSVILPDNSSQSEGVCFGQDWLDSRLDPVDHVADLFPGQKGLNQQAMTTIAGWCQAVNVANRDMHCDYLVAPLSYAKENEGKRMSACVVAFHDWFAGWGLGFAQQGCFACGGSATVHVLNFFVTSSLTFAVASRLYRCYEDYVLQLHRMMYFVHLTPWATMQQQRHEHWGLLPTFDLDCAANIAAWNKIRLFLQTYDTRSSRRLQVSVVYLLVAWLAMCVYQAVKLYQRRNESIRDIETIFVYSSTAMLTAGLVAILQTGLKRNEVCWVGVAHMLALKQADLLEKTAHFISEHDHFHGQHLHSQRADRWQCDCESHRTPGRDRFRPDSYDEADKKMCQLVEQHVRSQPHLSVDQEIGDDPASASLTRQSTRTEMEEWLRLRKTRDARPQPSTARGKPLLQSPVPYSGEHICNYIYPVSGPFMTHACPRVGTLSSAQCTTSTCRGVGRTGAARTGGRNSGSFQ